MENKPTLISIVNKTFYVRQSKVVTIDGKQALSMTVTDGETQRKAIMFEPQKSDLNIAGKFKMLSGTILNHDLLTVATISDADYSQINFGLFFSNEGIPSDVMFDYFYDLAKRLPTYELYACCTNVIQSFEQFTEQMPVSEAERNERISATREAFSTAHEWQQVIGRKGIEHRDELLAGLIVGSFSSFFEKSLSLPAWEMYPTEILACMFTHYANEADVDKSLVHRVKKFVHALCFWNRDELRDAIVRNTFYK